MSTIDCVLILFCLHFNLSTCLWLNRFLFWKVINFNQKMMHWWLSFIGFWSNKDTNALEKEKMFVAFLYFFNLIDRFNFFFYSFLMNYQMDQTCCLLIGIQMKKYMFWDTLKQIKRCLSRQSKLVRSMHSLLMFLYAIFKWIHSINLNIFQEIDQLAAPSVIMRSNDFITDDYKDFNK